MGDIHDTRVSEEAKPPFFVVGCEGSGTTLLSLILDSHSRIAVCRGSSYYRLFASERRYYGSLRDPANAARLINDFRRTLRLHHIDPPETEAIAAELRSHTFEDVLAAFLRLYARREGKVRAGERSPRQYLYLRDIVSGFERSPIVFVVRDPRDVAAAHRSGFDAPVEAASTSWNQAFRAYETASSRSHVVRYEDLVRDPQHTIGETSRTLGESFEPNMLRFYERTPDRYWTLSHHRRLFDPLDDRSVGEFRNLTRDEIARIEQSCARGMEAMGYEPSRPGRGSTVAMVFDEDRVARARRRLTYFRWDRDRLKLAFWHQLIVVRVRVRYLVKIAHHGAR